MIVIHEGTKVSPSYNINPVLFSSDVDDVILPFYTNNRRNKTGVG